METKCKSCNSRYEGCQDRCPYFIALQMFGDEIKEKRQKEKLKEDQMFKGIERSKSLKRSGQKSQIWRK